MLAWLRHLGPDPWSSKWPSVGPIYLYALGSNVGCIHILVGSPARGLGLSQDSGCSTRSRAELAPYPEPWTSTIPNTSYSSACGFQRPQINTQDLILEALDVEGNAAYLIRPFWLLFVGGAEI